MVAHHLGPRGIQLEIHRFVGKTNLLEGDARRPEFFSKISIKSLSQKLGETTKLIPSCSSIKTDGIGRIKIAVVFLFLCFSPIFFQISPKSIHRWKIWSPSIHRSIHIVTSSSAMTDGDRWPRWQRGRLIGVEAKTQGFHRVDADPFHRHQCLGVCAYQHTIQARRNRNR